MSKTIKLDENATSIQFLCQKDKRLEKVIQMVGPLEYQIYEDGYVFLVHEIIEQMLSIKAGAKIFKRLLDLCQNDISVDSITLLSDENLSSIGTSKNKVSYIRNLTTAISNGNLSLSELDTLSDESVIHELTRIKGIGLWTAKMYLIFVLNRSNVLPLEDVAFLQSYKWLYKTEDTTKNAVSKKCKKWSPYSSIAARYLYRALDTGLTKSEFHLYK